MPTPKVSRPVYICNCGDHYWQHLARGMTVLVSPEDAHLLDEGPWYIRIAGKRGAYPERYCAGQSPSQQRMHMAITGLTYQDHASRNGMDNRRSNLRPATNSQNSHNKFTRKNKNKFRGVLRILPYQKWSAQIRVQNQRFYLGCFNSPEEAAHAYDEAARKHFGEFARVNFS